jgi:hypothetical protein
MLVVLLSTFGCVESESGKLVSDSVANKCVSECKLIKDKGIDLSNGPCLGIIATDWVCDVAHNPRQSVDNLPQNKCEDYQNGNANNFVEVDESCNLISVN